MNVRRLSISTALGLTALVLGSQAKAEDAKWYDTTKVSGFVDGYYKFNPDGRKTATAATTDMVFDKHQNMASLAGGKLELSSLDGMALVDLYFGDYGNALQSGLAKPEPAVVGQAFISQPLGPVTVTLGRFATHIGYEVIDSVANLNYTRGLLYNAVPFYHQGIKLAYSPMEGLGLMAQIDNGASKNYTSSGEETAGGAQLSYTGVKALALYLNYYYEPTKTAGGVWEKNHYIDVVSSYGIMDGLTFAAEYLYVTSIGASDTNAAGNAIGTSMTDWSTGKQVPFSPKTNAYAVYLDYATPITGLSITPRFEAVYTPDSTPAVVGDGGQSKFDYTLTARYTKGALINWLEFRADAADDAIYPAPVSDPSKPSYTEMAMTWGVGYKF